MGFAWNLILFSFMREREGYKHHADCTVICCYLFWKNFYNSIMIIVDSCLSHRFTVNIMNEVNVCDQS